MVEGVATDELMAAGFDPRLSIKFLVTRHLEKISDIMTKELTAGYWEKKPIKFATGAIMSEEYHSDMREAFCNAVFFLTWLLEPGSDDEFKRRVKELTQDEINLARLEANDEVLVYKKLKIYKEYFIEVNKYFFRANYWSKSPGLRQGVKTEFVQQK